MEGFEKGNATNFAKPNQQWVFSEADLNVMLKSLGSLDKKRISEILAYVDPNLQYDKILEKSSLWTTQKYPETHVDLKAMRTKDLREYNRFAQDPLNWIYNYTLQYWASTGSVAILKFKDTNPPYQTLSKVKFEKPYNKLVCLKGVIRRLSQTNSSIVSSTYVCKYCKREVKSNRAWYEKIKLPPYCPCFSKDSWIEQQKRRLYEIWQTATIQDSLEQSGEGSLQTLQIRIKDSCFYNQFLPGQSVLVVGVLKTQVNEKAKVKTYLDAFYIESLQQKKKSLAKKNRQYFENLIKEGFEWNVLRDCIFRKIYGLKDLKDFALLQLFGGSRTSRRPQIHLLCVGQPGSGKSQTMRLLKDTFGGIYVTGMGATSAGLTASVYKDSEGQWQVDAGALVCANTKTLYLDELDKMSSTVASSLLQGMEQQTVSVCKAGLNLCLPAKTKVFASSNPRGKNRIDFSTPVIEQIGLPLPLISRFDAIVVVENEYSEDQFIPKSDVELDKVEQYILYAKQISVKVPEEVQLQINKFYKSLTALRSQYYIVSPRQLESMYRLTEAKAKSRLSSEASKEDFFFVKQLITRMYSKLFNKDIFEVETASIARDLIDCNLTKRESSYSGQILEFLKDSDRTKKSLFDLLIQSSPEITVKQYTNCLFKLEKEGYIHIYNQMVKLIRKS